MYSNREGGMITPQPAPSHLRGQHEEVVPRAGDGGEGEGGLGVYRHLPLVGFAHKRTAVGGVVERGGEEGVLGRAGRLQASYPREAFQARPQVSCFQGSGFRTGLDLSFRV